jgi:hypothetical protein
MCTLAALIGLPGSAQALQGVRHSAWVVVVGLQAGWRLFGMLVGLNEAQKQQSQAVRHAAIELVGSRLVQRWW